MQEGSQPGGGGHPPEDSSGGRRNLNGSRSWAGCEDSKTSSGSGPLLSRRGSPVSLVVGRKQERRGGSDRGAS